MKTRFLLVCAFCCLACAPARHAAWFSGLIVYHNEFRNAAGDVVASNAGPENLFYIHGSSYKLCGGNKQLLELYTGKTRTLQTFRGGRASTVTAADPAVAPVAVAAMPLPSTAVILGHACRAVQLVRAGVTSVVYFSPDVRVNIKGFSQCPFGYWYELLKATDGALPLRTISVYSAHGYTATSEATAVQALALSDRDFTPAAPVR